MIELLLSDIRQQVAHLRFHLMDHCQQVTCNSRSLFVAQLLHRNEKDVNGSQITVPYISTNSYFDVYHGTELTPQVCVLVLEILMLIGIFKVNGAFATLNFTIEAHGYGAVLSINQSAVTSDLKNFLSVIICLWLVFRINMFSLIGNEHYDSASAFFLPISRHLLTTNSSILL
jgi:hypothetical protein